MSSPPSECCLLKEKRGLRRNISDALWTGEKRSEAELRAKNPRRSREDFFVSIERLNKEFLKCNLPFMISLDTDGRYRLGRERPA